MESNLPRFTGCDDLRMAYADNNPGRPTKARPTLATPETSASAGVSGPEVHE